jgi:hypothetical protein
MGKVLFVVVILIGAFDGLAIDTGGELRRGPRVSAGSHLASGERYHLRVDEQRSGSRLPIGFEPLGSGGR